MPRDEHGEIVQTDTLPALRGDDLPGQQMLPAIVESVLGQLGSQAFHNFQGDQLQVWQQVSLATGPLVVAADKILDQPIELERFYVHKVQVAGPTAGEYDDAVRVVLMTPSGHAYGFTSQGVAADLARIIGAFGMGPYTPPIKIKVVKFTTRRGRQAYSIQPA